MGNPSDNFIVTGYVLHGSSWSILCLQIYLEPLSSLCSMLNHAHHKMLHFSAVVLCTCGAFVCSNSAKSYPLPDHLHPLPSHPGPWTAHTVLYDFIIPTICVDSFVIVVVFPISLNWVIGYLFVCVLILNWKFQVPQLRPCLHSAQRPVLSSMYSCHSHLSITTFPPTSGIHRLLFFHLFIYIFIFYFIFPSLKEWLYPLPSIITL